MLKTVIHLCFAGLAIYGAFLLLLFLTQRGLIYYPSRISETAALQTAARNGWQRWIDEEGRFHGWLGGRLGPADTKAAAANRLIVFHGNAGHALHRGYFFDGFGLVGGGALWEVRVFEYPGYGPRDGVPGERAIVDAAGTALESLLAEDARPVYLLGESLGSGVAAALARERPEDIAGLVFVTPFTSLPDAASAHYPIVPTRLLLRDRYEVLSALADYPGPLAVRIAGRDEILPPEMGRRLVEAHRGPARLWSDESARHNTLDHRADHHFWSEVSDFLLATPPQSPQSGAPDEP